ncbi:pectinesterase [Edaphobacter acidisoli]|uniref:Pectinesterase n=1 Tax=Edaphobacter acidisoli TaxID=2040573 RepID=A0A916VZT0_9BACT|nr:pectinesterase family protein [Edaphobacter acidisoli]GGA54717.1 pectinesterase [Edaphobacter acidisoli]
MRLEVAGLAFLVVCGVAGAQMKTITVGAKGADFTTIQAAVDAAPATGAVIRIEPGVYREVVHVDQSHIQFRGQTDDPSKVELVYGNSAASTCGTSCSATLFVTGTDFIATDMTIANDYSKTSDVPSQAVALSVRGDRAVFRHVRLLGAQDTLYAASGHCMNGAVNCTISRQYYADCYIEGHVDFIFGDAKAVFDHCEIHSIPHIAGGYLTAQSNTRPGQDSGYVFNHCKLTADEGAGNVYLGRPWRDYATVVYLNTWMGKQIMPAGWSDWKSAPAPRLPMTTYAEFNSTGPGADAKDREPYAKQLTAAEAAKYETKAYMAGNDGWNPEAVK